MMYCASIPWDAFHLSFCYPLLFFRPRPSFLCCQASGRITCHSLLLAYTKSILHIRNVLDSLCTHESMWVCYVRQMQKLPYAAICMQQTCPVFPFVCRSVLHSTNIWHLTHAQTPSSVKLQGQMLILYL